MSHAVIIKSRKKIRELYSLKQVDLEIQPGEFFTLLGPIRLRQDDPASHDRGL